MRASRKPIVSSSASGIREDVGVRSERNPDADPMDGSPQLCFGMDADDDALLHKGYMRRFGVDITG